MAVISKFIPTTAGATAPSFVAAAGGGDLIDQCASAIVILKTSGTISNVTFVIPGSLPNGDAYPDKVITMPATGERWIVLGPEYADANGQCSVTYSSVTGLTIAAVHRA
jgi:hypothetical protein